MSRLHAALAQAATGETSVARRTELVRRFELAPAEAAVLLAIEEAALERYAGSLVGKRRGELERVVPLTRRVCPDLGARYVRWLAEHPAAPRDDVLAPGEAEALRALPELAAELEADESLVAYAAELLRFEVLRTCSRRDGERRELVTGIALSQVLADLERGLVPTEAAPHAETHRFSFPRTEGSAAGLRESTRHFVGAGIGYRARYREGLLSGDGVPQVLELVPDHFFARPEAIGALAERFSLVFHDVGLSLGTLDRRDEVVRARLRRLRTLVERARPLVFSDHLALTRSSRVDLGHLCPLWMTRAVLSEVVDAARFVQDELGMGLSLENIALPFLLDGADYEEPEFFHELGERAGVGLLLDVSNLLVNARNFGFAAEDLLERYPLERVSVIHLAGSRSERGFEVDSHDAPVSDASYALVRQALVRARPRAIIVERDERMPALAELLDEARRAEALA
ncbi:MAG TPA: DUF692 family protein [Polyangiaceae bacterium]|nr:DUF692 family protein [Polyangiaceae bacterium]